MRPRGLMLKTSYKNSANSQQQMLLYEKWHKTKDDKYLDELLSSFLSLIYHTLKCYGMASDDSAIIIWNHLYKSLLKYQKSKATVYTFVSRCITYKTIELKRKENRKKRQIDTYMTYVDPDVICKIIDNNTSTDNSET